MKATTDSESGNNTRRQNNKRKESPLPPFWSNFQPTSSSGSGRVYLSPSMKRFSFLDGELEESIHTRISNYVSYISSNLSPEVVNRFLSAITLCLNNIGNIREFITTVREILDGEEDPTLFSQLVHLMVYGDFPTRMCDYLRENGVDELELPTDYSEIDQQGVLETPEVGQKAPKKKGTRRPPNKWTKDESQRLIELVEQYGDKRWKKISQVVGGGKSGAQCAQHWKRVLCPEIRKGSWDVDEEDRLFELVTKYGQSWKKIAIEIKTRTDIQCRYQYLKACMSREEKWSVEEDRLMAVKVLDALRLDPNVAWLEVTRHLMKAKRTKIPRTALECKTRWEEIRNRFDILVLEKSLRETSSEALLQANLDPIGMAFPLSSVPNGISLSPSDVKTTHCDPDFSALSPPQEGEDRNSGAGSDSERETLGLNLNESATSSGTDNNISITHDDVSEENNGNKKVEGEGGVSGSLKFSGDDFMEICSLAN